MANAIYPKWKEALEQASADSALTGTVKAVLLDLGVYSYNAAHDMYDDLSGVVGAALRRSARRPARRTGPCTSTRSAARFSSRARIPRSRRSPTTRTGRTTWSRGPR